MVYPSTSGPEGVSLLTNAAASQSVSAPELIITIVLFVVVYVFLFAAWVRIIGRFIKQGPQTESMEAVQVGADVASAPDANSVASSLSKKTQASSSLKDGE